MPREMDTGKPLDEVARRRLEPLFGYDLREVRVHDSRQAAELARRLGAEAFTMQRHIFGPGEKLSVLTPQGSGLLAHEVTHVIQQTEPQRLSQGDWSEHVLVPQTKPPAPQPGHRQKYASEPVAHLQNENPNSSSSRNPGSITPSPSEAARFGKPVSLRVTTGVVQREAEAAARTNEQAVSQALEREREAGNQTPAAASQVNPEEVANKVYRLMLQDLVLEKERGAVLD